MSWFAKSPTGSVGSKVSAHAIGLPNVQLESNVVACMLVCQMSNWVSGVQSVRLRNWFAKCPTVSVESKCSLVRLFSKCPNGSVDPKCARAAQSYGACVCTANYLLLEIKRFLQVLLVGICVSMRDCLSTEIFLNGILTVSLARQF